MVTAASLAKYQPLFDASAIRLDTGTKAGLIAWTDADARSFGFTSANGATLSGLAFP